MANKITKKEMFSMIKDMVKDNAEMVAFLDHEIELLEKKGSNKKLTKTQEENKGIKTIILDVMRDKEPMSISEMQKISAELGALSNQKVSALMRQLIADNLVDKKMDKKVSLFFLVSPTDAE